MSRIEWNRHLLRTHHSTNYRGIACQKLGFMPWTLTKVVILANFQLRRFFWTQSWHPASPKSPRKRWLALTIENVHGFKKYYCIIWPSFAFLPLWVQEEELSPWEAQSVMSSRVTIMGTSSFKHFGKYISCRSLWEPKLVDAKCLCAPTFYVLCVRGTTLSRSPGIVWVGPIPRGHATWPLFHKTFALPTSD